MKRVLDRTKYGELWADNLTGLPVYHIEGDGFSKSTTKPGEAKKLWKALNEEGERKAKAKKLSWH